MESRHWMIWDGECGLCSSTAQAFRRRDPDRKKFQIVQYQHCPSPPMTPEVYARCDKEMYVITSDGQALPGVKGFLFAMKETGAGSWVTLLSYPPFIWIMQAGYWLVARNRGLISRLFFGGKACGIDNRYPEVD